MAEKFLFKRLVKVIVANRVAEDFKTVVSDVTEITDLRVRFKVKKNGGTEPNTAEVTITNLNIPIQKKGVKFILQAGYEDVGISQLFIGDVRTADRVRDGADWNTTLKSGDGERAFRHARVNESFAPGVKIPDVVKTVAGKLGLSLGNLDQKIPNITGQFNQGYVAHGPASVELGKALAAAGYQYSIQDEQLQILKADEGTALMIPDLSPQSGLIGSPEFGTPEKKGAKPLLKVRCLLNGNIKLKCQVFVRSSRHNGPVRVEHLEHTGDTAGGDWYTDFEASVL